MDGKAQPVRDETCPDLKVLHSAMPYIDSFMSPKYLQFKRSEPPGGVLRYIIYGEVRSPFLGLKWAIWDFF